MLLHLYTIVCVLAPAAQNLTAPFPGWTNVPVAESLGLVCKSRQKTGSGGRLSASGITCKGYTEWTQNKKRADAQRWGDSGGLRTHPGVSRVYFHSSWNPERQNSRWTGERAGQARGLTHYTSAICKGGSAFISETRVPLRCEIPLSRRHADIRLIFKQWQQRGAVKMFILKTCRVTRWRPVLKWHEKDVAEI